MTLFGGDLGVALVSALYPAFFGWGIAVAYEESVIRRFDTRIQRYDQFKAALIAFEAARRETEERELRKREEFWLSLSGHRFERELATLFRGRGYDVKLTPGSGDQGVDIILKRSGRTTVVQCKQTKGPVGPAAARDLYGTLTHFEADDGILATVGGATSGVHSFFNGKPLRVMNLSEIIELQRETGSDTALARRGASESSIAAVPESYTALEAKSLALHRLQRFKEALVCFDKASEGAQNTYSRSWAWNYKGATLLRLGLGQDALEWCDKAIDASPKEESAFWVNKGNCLRHLRRLGTL